MMLRKISVLILFALQIAVGILFLTSKKQEISYSEKRELAKFPDFSWKNYFSGDYTKGINLYINDHFPYREKAVRFTETFRYSLGFHLKNKEKIVVINKKKDKKPKKSENEEEEETVSDKEFMDDFEAAYDGSVVIINGKVYTLNTGTASMSPLFAKMLNEYADTLGTKTRVFSCVVPLSSGFIPVAKYESYNRKNKETLDAIKNSLSPKVYFSDVFKEMNNHFNENLWFGSDHHWTGLGAYYGYVAYCKSAGIKPVPLESMEVKKRYPFLGSLYELTRDKSVRDNPDTVVLYIPPNVEAEAFIHNAYDLKNPKKSKVFCSSVGYTAFICGDSPLVRITTNVKNGKRAAVVKNSMGNAFAVYLISHYEEIYVFDFRYSKHNILKIIKDAEINDLIFALGMYGAMSKGTIGMMRNLKFHKAQDYEIVKQREAEKRVQDSLSRVEDSLKIIELNDDTQP